MNHPVLLVSAGTRIARPIELVRRHFADVEHHARNPVHPDVEFAPLSDYGDECRFRKRIHVLGVPVVDEVVLRREADGSVTESFVAGPSTGMRLVSRFRSEGPELTTVTLTVEIPIRGLKRLVAPLLRRGAFRRMTKALDEDRRDLEQAGYPR